eukprot:1155227-Pelagomonas_calceolata.AAC.2
MQAAPAIHCLLAPLDKQQQTAHQRLPHPHTRTEGAGPAPHRISKLCAIFSALTSQLAVHITPSLEHELIIPLHLELYKTVGSSASWNGLQVDCEVPRIGTSRSWTQQGHLQNMLMKFVSTGAVPGPEVAGLKKSKPNLCGVFAPKLCTLHPRSPKLDSPGKKVCLASFPSFKEDGRLAGSGQETPAEVSKRRLQLQPLPPMPPQYCRATKQFCLGG